MKASSTLRVENSQLAGKKVLVTGSGGFIGAKVVELLLEYGVTDLRCFVRPSSNRTRLDKVLSGCAASTRVEVISGDLLSPADCRRAVAGVSIVYHLAAGVEKSFAGAFMNSALATRNLAEAFLEAGSPERFVSVSSFAVYSNRHLRRGDVLDESCPIEDASQERYDPYGFGKICQDRLIMQYGKERGLPFVILRPGTVFGPGRAALSGRVGVDTFGVFLHMGGSKRLPLTYVDNCAEAIVLAGFRPGVIGEVFNVVDDELLGSGEFLRRYKKAVGGFTSLPVPYFLAMALSRFWEWYARWSQGQLPPVFNRRRCAAEWMGNRYSNRKLRERLDWKPRVSMNQGMELFLAQFSSR